MLDKCLPHTNFPHCLILETEGLRVHFDLENSNLLYNTRIQLGTIVKFLD